jgi:hypothetical protein
MRLRPLSALLFFATLWPDISRAQVVPPPAGYSTVQDEGSNVTRRKIINFIGGSISCVDDAGGTRTNCTLTTVTPPFSDVTSIVSDDGDNTKQVRIEVSGVSAGNTRVWTAPNNNTSIPIIAQTITIAGPTQARTYTFPDGAFTMAASNNTNTWSQAQTFSSTTIFGSEMRLATDGTTWIGFGTGGAGIWQTSAVGHPSFWTNSENAISIQDRSRVNSDQGNGPGGSSNNTNPWLVVHGVANNTTDYGAVGKPGIACKFVKTLTESSATNVITFPVANDGRIAGTLQASVFASNGTVHQVRFATLRYVATNEADTETCVLSPTSGVANCGGTCDETNDENTASIPSGTLEYDWACAAGTNAVTITLNAVSSLTQTTLNVEGCVIHTGAGEPLPQ